MDKKTNSPQIYTVGKLERLFFAKYRTLRPSIFEAAMHRIMNGDSLTNVAKFLHVEKPETAMHTWRKYLSVLARDIRQAKVEITVAESGTTP